MGGLDALQKGAILAATPFAAIMLVMCWSLLRAMSEDVASGAVQLDQPRRSVAPRTSR